MSRASSAPGSRSPVDDDEGPRSRMLRRISVDDPLIGRVLDQRYRIETVLGAGGVGVVYRAEHTGLRRPVALKVLRHGFEENAHLRRRFEREARVLSQLSHPNVVALTDYGIADGLPYLVMELLEGRTLEDFLEEEGPPPARIALEIVRAVVRGLAFAHDRGVLHRDLKPGNVFLQALPDDPNHVKLLDFGLAKLLFDEDNQSGEDPTLTKTGTIVGTPAYMSPEQASGGRVDPRSDVYAAGVLLFELFSGRVPFEEPRRADLLRAHLVDPVPDPEGIRPGLTLSPAVQELLLKCLAKEPSERFDDARVLLAALDALPEEAVRFEPVTERGRPTTKRSLAEAHAVPVPRRKKRSVGVVVGLASVLVVAGGAAWLLTKRGTELDAGGLDASGELDASGAEVRAHDTTRDTTVDDPTAQTAPALDPLDEVTPEDDDSGSTDAIDAEPTALPEDRDPFATPLPPELEALALSLGAAPGDRDAHRQMRVYQRLHPDDPRPSLLLAHDFADRGAWPQAMERYDLALRRDVSARHDPRMLDDLLTAAQMEPHAATARQLIARNLADRARPRVQELLARSEHRPTRILLRALDAALGD